MKQSDDERKAGVPGRTLSLCPFISAVICVAHISASAGSPQYSEDFEEDDHGEELLEQVCVLWFGLYLKLFDLKVHSLLFLKLSTTWLHNDWLNCHHVT